MKIVTKKSLEKEIKEECWNLDFELIKWVNKHFKVFKEDAIKVVDLEHSKYKYKNKEYTQLEIIDRVIEITDNLLGNEPYESENGYYFIDSKELKKISARKNEMYDLLKLVHWDMWW